uniref:Uncharacterized protein n=1 Tax=Anopheles farauti TaxID=69004 RepID=A0A182Q1Y3_9DIPT
MIWLVSALGYADRAMGSDDMQFPCASFIAFVTRTLRERRRVRLSDVWLALQSAIERQPFGLRPTDVLIGLPQKLCALHGTEDGQLEDTGIASGRSESSTVRAAQHLPLKCFGQQTNSTPEKSEMPQGSSMAKLRICMLRSWQAAAPVWFHLTNGQQREALWM